MKKIISLMSVLALTGCGGSEYFSEPSADFSQCLVGNWEKSESLYFDESLLINYNADGTYFRESTRDYGSQIQTYLLNQFVAYIFDAPANDSFRYVVNVEAGKWKADGNLLRHYDAVASGVTGNDFDYVYAEAYRQFENAEPKSNTPAYQLSTHCDNQFSTLHDVRALHRIDDNPLTYTKRSEAYNQLGTFTSYSDLILTLKEDGTATRRSTRTRLDTPSLSTDTIENYTYRYSNDKIILTPCSESASCPNPGLDSKTFYDRDFVVSESQSYFQRVN